MPYSPQTLNVTTVGFGWSEYLKDLAGTAIKCGKVEIHNDTGDAIYVQVGAGTKPALPTNAFIPGADVVTRVKRIDTDDIFEFGVDPDGKGFIPGLQEPIEWVAGWAVQAGFVSWLGH